MKQIKLPLLAFLSLFLLISAFGQVGIPRQTTAITYPLDEVVMLQFRGTTRFPRMKGDARIKRTGRNGTEIELSVSKMPRPFELGAGYATYVLWAISPDGQIDNLGEIKRRGFFEFDSRISVTTPLQQFALIITAEPHFLVKQPSRAVMLENLFPTTLSGRTVPTTKSIQYFGNSSDFFRDARTPEIAEIDYAKTPSTILQAQQALALARFSGAGRDAAAELQEAETLLQNADNAWKAGRPEEQVDISARQAIGAAVKAEETAVARKSARDQRNEKQRQDAEIREAEDKYQDAMRQIEELKAELSRETRNRELVERDSSNFSQIIRELREENGKLREEIGKIKVELESSKNKLSQIEAQKQAEKDEQERQRLAEEKRQQILSGIPILMQSLKPFGSVKQHERGVALSLAETYWSGIRLSGFSASANQKLEAIAGLISGNPDYNVVIEAHTDNKGAPEALNLLTQERAQAISNKLVEMGIDQSRIEVRGFGGSYPLAPNTTNANRAKNRRTDLILALKPQN